MVMAREGRGRCPALSLLGGRQGQVRYVLSALIVVLASSALAQEDLPSDRSPTSVRSEQTVAADGLVAAPSTTGADPPSPLTSGLSSGAQEPALLATVPSATSEIRSSGTATTGVPTEETSERTSSPALDVEPPSTIVDQFQAGVSAGLLNTAVWLDSFFGDERHEAESNDSHFKVSSAPLFEDGSWSTFRPDYELRLVLPQLRRKTRLVVSGDMWNDGEEVPDTTAGPIRPAVPEEDRDVATSLQVVLPSHKRHSTTLRAGVRYHSGDLIYYAGPRYRYLLPLSRWTARFTENIIWEGQQGWRSGSRIDLERSLPYDLFFRSSLDGLWQEDVTGYLYSVAFLLRQPLDQKRAVQYQWINLFQTRPVDALTEVRLVFQYRQQVWRPWLFLEIAPQYRFPRDRSFEATPGIMFRLEMVFSKERGDAPGLP